MRNKTLAVFLGLLLMVTVTMVEADSKAGVENTFEGTDVEEVHDWHDLDGVRDELSGDYILIEDLDEDTLGYDELVDTPEGWKPIGSFSGTFDGNGNEIRDLYIDRLEKEHIGLFGYVQRKAEITDVSLRDVEVRGGDHVGALIGMNNFGQVKSCYSIGTVSGNDRVGGLVGTNFGADSIVDNSFAFSEVTGEEEVGGLVGYNFAGTVRDSYAMGDMLGERNAGGLVGYNSFNGKIFRSYAAVEVDGEDRVGGLVGQNHESKVYDSYWDVDKSGEDRSDGGTILTTDEMTGESALTNMTGFDFEEIWESVKEEDDDAVEDGYPILQKISGEEQLEAQGLYPENDDIPGFTFILLLSASVLAAAVYKRVHSE